MAATRKIAAILVADIVGYSRLAGADEDRTLARLRALRSDLIDPTIAVHNGRIFKRTGDGSLVEFRSVVDAVRCAVEMQNGLAERNSGLSPERRIEFRVGIHLGDVVEEADGDLMGDGVNIAARLEGICEPGAICLSEDAYRQVKGRLDLAITDLGPTQLKNIAEPIRVYSLEVGKPAQAKPPDPKKRSALALLAAGIAALFIVIAAGAWYLFIANRPAVVTTTATAPAASNAPRRSRPSVFPSWCCPSPIFRRSGAGLPRRRTDRRIDHEHRANPSPSSSRATPPSPTRASRSTPRRSARIWACAMCWKARCNRAALR